MVGVAKGRIWVVVAGGRTSRAPKTQLNSASGRTAVKIDSVIVVTALFSQYHNAISADAAALSSIAVIVVAYRLIAVGAVGNLVDGTVEAAGDVADKALQGCG